MSFLSTSELQATYVDNPAQAWAACAWPEELMKMCQITRQPDDVYRRIALFCAGLLVEVHEVRHPGDGRPRKAFEALQTYLDEPDAANALRLSTALGEADDSVVWSLGHFRFWDKFRLVDWFLAQCSINSVWLEGKPMASRISDYIRSEVGQ